jgi:hypothetical protein
MQIPQQQPVVPEDEPGPALEDAVRELWPCLDSQAISALRSCCTPLRDASDAHISGLDGPSNADAPVLSAAACARLCGVLTMTLRSMSCLRGMQLVAPHPQPHPFPRLKSMRVLIDKVGGRQGQIRPGGMTRHAHGVPSTQPRPECMGECRVHMHGCPLGCLERLPHGLIAHAHHSDTSTRLARSPNRP